MRLFCYVLQMLFCAARLRDLVIVLVPPRLHLSQWHVNGLMMGCARVWLAFICAASILVSATDAPLSRTSVCRPCPESCVCLLLNDGTCSVDCAGAGLSAFPLDLPTGKRKIVLDVGNNNLTDLHIHHLVHLSHLKSICLANNPWFCGCTTYWSSRWLEESARRGLEIEKTDDTRCHEPLHLKNVPLMQIGNLSHLCTTPLDFISYVKTELNSQALLIDYMVQSVLTLEQDGCDQFCFDQDFPVAALSTLDHLCRCGRPAAVSEPYLTNISEPAEGNLLNNKFYIRNAHFINPVFYFRMEEMAVSSLDEAIISVHLPIVPSHCDWEFGENGLQLFRYFGIACRVVHYRYVWPGLYTVTALMSSVNGSVQASRNISIVVQDPINAVVLPFPSVVPAHRPLNVTIMMSSGTNVSITWNILNDTKALWIETIDQLINVPKYVAGVGQFSQYADHMVPARESTIVPSISPLNETTLYLFPGWWFSHSGILQKWIYYRNISVTNSTLRFQVYRPHCVNATSYLLHPGSGSEFTTCSNDEQFSTFEHNCSFGLQYCPLSKTCQLRQSPCTCRTPHIDATESCVNATKEWHHLVQNLPDYSLVGDWPVEDTTEDDVGLELSTNISIAVQRNDIIGLQFVSEVPPVRCIRDERSPWRQSVIAIHQSSWMARRTEISVKSLALHMSVLDDVVCDVMAVYSTPELIRSHLPVSLPPGLHTVSFNLSNLISYQTKAVELIAVAEIEEFSLKYPTQDMLRPPISDDSVGKLIVEADTYTTFVFSIAQGSAVHLTNSIDSTQVLFEPVCPVNLPPEFICNSSLSYAIKEIGFTQAQNISGLQIAFTARNEVCVKTIFCDVLSLKHIRNINLTRSTMQRWPSFLDVHVFSAVVSDEVLISSYQWTTSDDLTTVSEFPELKHIFYTAGQHTVSVNASNDLSFQTATLNVTVYQPSDVNISLPELPDVVPTGTVVAVPVLLEMKPYSIVRCNFTVMHDFVVTVNTTSVVYVNEDDEQERFKKVSFQFNVLHRGIYLIQVVALDELLPGDRGDETSRVSDVVNAEDPITGLALSSSKLTQNDSFTYLLTASVTTGSNMTLYFKIGRSVVNTSQLSIKHEFTKSGLYLVQVVATNRVSRSQTNLTVNITSDELIEGPALVGCCSEIFSTETNISFAMRVDKDSQQYYSCTWLIVHRQKLIAYHKGYHVTFHVRSPGDYSVTVELRHREIRHILTDKFIVQEPVSLVHLYTNAGFDGVFIHQELVCTAIHTAGSHLSYQWNITAQSGIFEITNIHANRMTALFYSNNTYEVHVFARNDISNASASAIVRVLVCNPPVLQLVGSTHRQELRSQRIAVEVIVQSCIFHQASHKWIVYRENCSVRIERVPLPPSITTDTSALHLPPRSLPYGMYCLHFSSEYVKTVNRSEIFVDLAIVASPLKALIFGGDERALTVNEKIILDGTQSYDPDVDEGDPSQITYSWSCQTSPQNNGRECFQRSNQSIYELSPDTFKENLTYIISLSVASSKRGQTQSTSPSTAVQKIHGKSADVPQVSINCISCRDKNLFAITRSQIIKLVGNCIGESCQEGDDYRWTVTRNDSYKLPLNSETTTTGGDKRNLVVREFILNCSYSYTFTLYVSSSASDVVGYASIVMKPLQAPKNGTCSLRIPQSGFVVALVNPVFVVCSGWIDDASSASQLEYHIYVNETSRLNPRWYPLYRGPRGNLTFYLSPFRYDTELVQLSVQVIDSERSMTKAVKQLINVTSPPSRMDLLTSLIFEELEQEINHNDPRQIIPRIIAILLQLNIESRTGNSSQEAQQERERMRTELMMYLNQTMTIGAIQDMQQVAFAMQLVTDVPSEFPRNPVHYHLVLKTLENVIEVIKPYISQGWQGEEFMPSYLLDTSTNLIDNLYFLDRNGENLFDSENSKHRQTIQTAANLVDLIMVILFQTKIAEEEPVSFYTTLAHCWGHRIPSRNVLLKFTSPGAVVSFPPALTSLDQHMEIFQYVSTFNYNPFQWGYVNGSPVTSKVVTVSFFDTLGQEVGLPELPDNQGIEISIKRSDDIPKEIDDGYWTDLNPSYTSATSETSHRQLTNSTENPVPANETDLHISLLPRESKSALVKLSASSFSAVGLTFKVITDANNETSVSDEALHNITMMVYIGQNYVPHEYKSEYSFQLMLQRHNLSKRHHAHEYHFLSSQQTVERNGSFYLTFVNNAIERSLEIVLTFHVIHCKSFNKEGGFWDTNGCMAVNATEMWTTCKCSNLTTVGASNYPVPAMLEFVPLTGLVFSGNPIIITTVLVVLVFVIVGFVLAWYWDRVEMVRSSLVPLCGKDGPFRYEVLVFTGRLFGSGTTANVGVRLYGEVDRSENVHLFCPGAFRRGAQDRFVIANQSSLGPVKKLVIWHDNTGSHPDWSLARVAVRDLQTNVIYHFLANCTLSLKSSEMEIEKTVTVAAESDLSRFCNRFHFDLSYRHSEQHLWLSVLDCCSGKHFSHAYRLLCCATSLCCILAICTIYYGFVEQQSDYEELMGESSFKVADVLLATISSAISFTCSALLLEAFRATKQQVSRPEMLSRRQSISVMIEMDCDVHGRESSHVGSFSSSLFDRSKPNVLNPSDLLELDIDRMSDSTSLNQPVTRKQLHRTSVLTSASQSTSQTGSKMMSSRTVSDSLMPSQSDDSHLWSSEMILSSWPERVNDLSTVSDDLWLADSTCSYPEGLCSNATRSEPGKRLASSSAPNIAQSSETSEEHPRESMGKKLGEGRRVLSKETPYDSGAIISDEDEGGSVGDFQVYQIPVHSASYPSSTALKAEHFSPTSEPHCRNSKKSMHRLFMFPHWFSYITWLLCIGIICGAIIVVLVIGHQFSMDLSLRWFAVSCSAFLLAAVVLETLKILVISIICSTNMKLIDLDAYQIFQSLSLEANEQFKSVRFRPLAGFALLQAKEEAKRSLVLHTLLRKLFIYIGFLAIVFAINYAPNAGNTAFLLSKSMDTMLVQMQYNKNESFKTIISSDDYWDWLESVFVSQLCTGGHAWNASSHYQYLLGPSRLRQLRSKKVSCLVKNKYGDKVGSEYDLCDGDPGWHEDTALHHTQWKPALEESNDTWKYHSTHSLNSIPYKGILGWYGGGGYVSLLPSSYMDAVEKINQLSLENWIDDGTRVVMLEFTIYNGNVDLFASVIMVVEFGLTGATHTTWHTYVFHPFVYPSANVTATIILESILLIYAIYLTIVIILTIRKSCVMFFKDIWTYVNVLITCLCWSSVTLFTVMVVIDTITYDHIHNSDGSTFIDFRESGTTHFAWLCINACLLMLTLILVVKQLRFVKFFATFYLAFRVSFSVVFGCTLIYSLLMITFCLTAYLWFGSEVLQFHSIGAAFVTLVAIFRGDSQVMVAMGEAHIGFSIVFIAMYLSAILFGVHSLIAGAFARAYGITRKQVNYHNAIKAHDHEVIPFLIKQLKRWIQKDKSKAAFRKVKFQDFSTLSSVSSSRSYLPDDELSAQGDEISAQGDEISAESEGLPELHENDSSLLHPVMNSTETVQDNLHSSLGEEEVTISASRDEAGTILSSSLAEVTISSLVEDNAGQEIAIPNLASCQQKDVTGGHGDSSADDDSAERHANPEDVLGDTDDDSSASTSGDPVESVIPAVTRVLEQLDKIGSIDLDDVNWRIEAATEKYLRKRINYHSNSCSRGLVDERTGLTKLLEASQEAKAGRAVSSQVSPSSRVEVTSSGFLAVPADLQNQDMTTRDSGVPMRTVAPPDRLLATSHQETWV